MAKPTRWGILSAGKISHDFVTCLRSIDDHEVVAVAARNVANANEFAKRHGIPIVLDNYEDLAKQDVDVVYCGALNTMHFTLVKHLLENKKPVLCEKPMTMNARDTAELVRIARENKVFLMEAIWSRFVPIYTEVGKQLDSIGEIQQVEAAFGLSVIGQSERATKPELGGSSLLDIGIYAIHFAQFIFKDEYPTEIRALGDLSPEGVDFQTAIVLKYSSGKLASLSTSFTADLSCEATAYGSDGRIKIENPFWCSESAVIKDKRIHIPFPSTVTECNYTNSSGLRYEAMHVRECLLRGLTESPILGLDVSLNIANIIQECANQIGVKTIK